MSDDQAVQLERRAAQRFDFHLPVAVRIAGNEQEGHGFSQNLSARGAFFYTDLPLTEGNPIELTLVMPSEITLAENMRVRCRGRVTRVVPMANKSVVAAYLEGYEFLPQAEGSTETSASYARISALHEHSHEEKSPAGLESRRAAAR
jgi:PilZ domain